jgi:hypothetical protein
MSSKYNEYKSPFRLEKSEYVREIDIIEGYFEQLSYYLSMMTGISLNECRSWVDVAFGEGGQFEHEFPIGEFLVQDPETQDRVRKNIPLDRVIKKCQEKDIIVAPSMAFYMPEKMKKSKLAAFFENNVRLRNIIKQQMFAASAAGNAVLHINKKNEQNSKKTLNNAGSGGFSSPFTILFNMSSHSALTSTCRTATSYGNACNERMLGGRRHYWAPGIIINHILSISTLTDWDSFKRCMDKYELYYPTEDDVMEVIMHSAKDYVRNPRAIERVRHVVSKMSSRERAAFTYMGDLYHIAKYNDAFMRGFIDRFITPVEESDITDADIEVIKKGIDGDMKIIVSQLRPDLIGIGGNFKKVEENNPEGYRKLIATCGHLQNTIGDYALFIRAILTTKNVPPTIARMPEVLRAVGVVSDTDSTMGSAQWWAKWYCGEYSGKTASMVSDTMVYIVVQNIAHLMANMSKQLGVSDEKLFTYAMKNEYKFDSFGLTTKAKDYFAQITSQEGTLKAKPELELKGVALRTSNIPNEIMDEYRATVASLLDDIAKGKDVNILPVVRRVAEIEKSIGDSIKNGEGLYLKTLDINSRESYKAESNYHYHRMFNETFGLKYGYVPEPPYHAVRIPVNLETKTEIAEWIERIEDRGLAEKLKEWFANEKRTYKQIIIPDMIVNDHGVPKELLDVVDARRTVFAMVEPYYHILEVFGVFMMDSNRTRLLSDYYDPSTETMTHPTDPQKRIDLTDPISVSE